MEKIRVMLVEDDPFWQKRLTLDLGREEDVEVAYAASTKEEAVEIAARHTIDVVLMDINLTANKTDGIDAARAIVKNHPHIKIIMLTSLDTSDVIIQSFQNGAVNFINKSSYTDIVTAIRAAYQNVISIHPDAAPTLIKEMQLSVLTPVEKEIYYLRERGLSRTQISERLFKSLNTIKTQLRSMKKKLLHEKEDD